MKLHRDKNWLYQQYILEKKSIYKIAEELNLTTPAIRYWMVKHNIPIRKQGYNDGSRRKYWFDQKIFENCDMPDKAYWIGYLMADGCVQDNGGNLGLSIVSKDKEMPAKFKECFNLPQKIVPKFTGNRKYHLLRVFSKTLVNSLFQYGIVFKKTGKEQIKNIPKKYLRDFIRGFFDGDGCVWLDGKDMAINFVSSSRKILDQIQNILIKTCSLNKTKISATKSQWGSGLRFKYKGNKQVGRIRDYLYQDANIFLERKHERFYN